MRKVGAARIKGNIKAEYNNQSFAWLQAKASFPSLIRSICTVSLLLIVEYFLGIAFESSLSVIPKWLHQLQSIAPIPTYPRDKDAIIEFASVIASISGVILALFYPVLATIASTEYAKTNPGIRSLLLSETTTQSYLRSLTFLTASAITILAALSIGLRVGLIVIAFLGTSSIINLFGILRIGLGIYNLFDPSLLSPISASKLIETIDEATWRKPNFKNANFQRHFLLQAHQQLNNLSYIMSVCLSSSQTSSTGFKRCHLSLLQVLKYYAKRKFEIPTDSEWFPKTYQHKSFFESDISSREMSAITQTLIPPAAIRDLEWFENRVAEILSMNVARLADSGGFALMTELISASSDLIDCRYASSKNKSIPRLLSSYLNAIRNHLNSKTLLQQQNDYDEWKIELTSIEAYGYLLLNFMLRGIDETLKYDGEKLLIEFSKLDFKDSSKLYRSDFLEEHIIELERMHKFIKNEIRAEGVRVTPNWYITQSLGSLQLKLIDERIRWILSLIETHFLPLLNIEEAKPTIATAFAAQIGLEMAHKLLYRLRNIENTIDSINRLEVCKKEFVWENPKTERFISTITSLEEASFTACHRTLLPLSDIAWSADNPDILSHAYATISRKLSKHLQQNSANKYSEIFPDFLASSLRLMPKLMRDFAHYAKPINIALQPTIEVLEISGYAYVYSVLHKNQDLWQATQSAWEKLFFASPENIKRIVSFYAYHKTMNVINGSFHGRFEREKELREMVTKHKITKYSVGNRLVSRFVPEEYGMIHEDFSELFIEMYLFTKLSAKSATSIFQRDLFGTIERIYDRGFDEGVEDEFD